MNKFEEDLPTTPDLMVSVRQTFGLNVDMKVPAFSLVSEHVPDVDPGYRFNHDTIPSLPV